MRIETFRAGTNVALNMVEGGKSGEKPVPGDIFVTLDYEIARLPEIPRDVSRATRSPLTGLPAGTARRQRGIFNPS
jgi:hypothetical protein